MPTNNNFGITRAGVLDFSGANNPEWVSNLGFSYSAGTFTIHDAQGTALSATNPAWVTLQSKASPGRLQTYKVTANQDFIDDAGASEIIGNLFGVVTGVAWAQDMPFYLYAVGNDAETAIAFMISRIPHATRSPVAAAIGAPDDAVSDSVGDFFSLDSLDESLFDENPCLCIGSFRMRMSSSDDHTVQTLTDQDGIGRFHEDTSFTMPAAQNGAGGAAPAAGTYLLANGGTAPVFTANSYTYFIKKSGLCHLIYGFTGDGGTDGSGAVQTRIPLPIAAIQNPSPNIMSLSGQAIIQDPTNGATLVFATLPGDELSILAFYETGTAASASQLADFSNGDRTIAGEAIFQIDGVSTT